MPMKPLWLGCLCMWAFLLAGGTGTAAKGNRYFGKSVREWRAQLQSENEFLRLYATRVLGQIGPKAVPGLMEALQHEDASVRYWAAVGLGNAGAKARRATPMLREALEDACPVVRVGVAAALWRIFREPAALQALMQALKDESDTVRLYAVHALARIGPAATEAMPVLRDALKDKYRYVANAANHALRDIEQAE